MFMELTASYQENDVVEGESGMRGGGGERKALLHRRWDEGTRILFKAEHFTAARSTSGNGGSPATPEELIRG